MIWSPPNRFTAVSPEELAAAMRAGLDTRRHVSGPASPGARPPLMTGPEFEHLREYLTASGVRGTRAPSDGVVNLLLNPVRRALKFLAAPWLERQTRANHIAFDHFCIQHAYLTELAVRINRLQTEIDGDVLAATRTANARLNEFFHDVAQLRSAVAAMGEGANEGPHAAVLRPLGSPPLDPVHVIESLYLCSRLPAPPARALVLAPVGLHGLSLANLGYAVAQYGLSGHALTHPQLSPKRGGSSPAEPLPFADASFDLVVSMAAEGESARGLSAADPHSDFLVGELDRVLGPDGVVVGSALVPAGSDAAELALDEWLAPFEPEEVRYARRAGHGWSLDAAPGGDCELVLFRAARGA